MSYLWYWNDEPDFALPHADHIEVMHEEGDEVCIIVVRHGISDPEGAWKRAEFNARMIVDALNASEENE